MNPTENTTEVRSTYLAPWTVVSLRVGKDIVVDVYHDDDDKDDDARFTHREIG